MFDQLVESSNAKKETIILGLSLMSLIALTTIVLFTVAISAVLIWSTFSFDLSFGDDSLELTTLVAPVPVPEPEPPKPEPEPDKPKQQVQDTEDKPQVATRTDNIQRIDESPTKPPDKAATERTDFKARPNAPFVISNKNEDPVNTGGPVGPTRNVGPTGPVTRPTPQKVEKEEEDEPPPKPTPKPTPKPEPTPTPVPKPKGPISGGVVNGKAVNLVKPTYPPQAKAVNASGAVNVQVVIDEGGRVISATAVSGHPLLRAAAVAAARASKFSPTMLSGQPVQVSGVIVYQFNP
jgi:TonB family protein